jgi:putative tricarboxylic transport membrane protein
LAAFPGLTSIRAQGIDTGELPEEFRGFVGPPQLPADALHYYQHTFATLVSAPGWNEFVDENGSVTDFLDADGFAALLRKQNASLSTLLNQLGLGQL